MPTILTDKHGNPIPVFGNPLPPVDITQEDLSIFDKNKKPVYFGIDNETEENITLEIENMDGETFTKLFRPGMSPLFIKRVIGGHDNNSVNTVTPFV